MALQNSRAVSPESSFSPERITEAQDMLGKFTLSLDISSEYSLSEVAALRDIAGSAALTAELIEGYRQDFLVMAKLNSAAGSPLAMEIFDELGDDPIELLHYRASIDGSLVMKRDRSAA